MKLEICVDSYESLLTAKKAGADRIELCSALNIGGLTPSFGLMKKAKELKDIEIFVMIRPRSGDFLYSNEDYEIMKEDIIKAKEMGFEGMVLGFLKADGSIDLERMKEAIELAKPMEVCLHRAFDNCKDPEKYMDSLIEMGVMRILTSGQKNTVLEGADLIKNLQKKYGDKITIMPGSGITSSNLQRAIDSTGCKKFHMSGKVNIGSKMEYQFHKTSGDLPIEIENLTVADFEEIKRARDILNRNDKKR